MTNEKKYLYMAGGVVALLLISRGFKLITVDLNPANENNVVNRVVESAYQAATGSTGTIGTDAYEVLHDEQGGSVLNPANENNVIYSYWNKQLQDKTGYTGTLGTGIYDILHDEKGNNVLNPFNWF
jgi:UDP-N-acetylmuramyl tripeptide synthase